MQDDRCRAVLGRWVSPYDGKVSAKPSTEVDIAHLVSARRRLARSGADERDTVLRRKFANGLTNPQLVAVPARSEGDQRPDQWQPPLHFYWSAYGRAWAHVKYVCHLNITEPQKDELGEMLDTCDA